MTNPSLVSYPEISKFLTQSFPEYKINYFAMGRVYRDGRFHSLAQDASWAVDHLVTNHSPPAGLINFDEIENKQLMFSLENYDTAMGWPDGTLLYARERYNIKNLLGVMIKGNNYLDQYLIDIHNTNAIDIYLNQLPLLERLFQTTLFQYKDLIKKIKKNPLVVDKKFLAMQKLKTQSRSLSKHEHLLYHNNQVTKLTDREYACLTILAKGSRVKDIAKIFQISPRTIETHLNNIKNKLKIYTIGGLTKCYWDNKEFIFE